MNFTDPRTSRLCELMTNDATTAATVQFATDWARFIGMVPIRVRKEQLGYSFNRLWRVIKKEVLRQIDQGYTTPEDVDRAWMLTFDTAIGPCGIMDEVGLHTVLAIEEVYFGDTGDESDRPPDDLIARVQRRELGVEAGKGFYEYPHPRFRAPDFLDDRESRADKNLTDQAE